MFRRLDMTFKHKYLEMGKIADIFYRHWLLRIMNQIGIRISLTPHAVSYSLPPLTEDQPQAVCQKPSLVLPISLSTGLAAL